MKVRFDENISPRVARTLKAFLSDESGLSVTHVREFHSFRTSDPIWLAGFAQEGGHAVVSGDANILQHWVDLVAYTESGLIAYFPPSVWDKMKGAAHAAFLMRWWPTLIEHMKFADRGTSWRIANSWNPSITQLEILRDPRLQSRKQQEALGIRPIARALTFRRQEDPSEPT